MIRPSMTTSTRYAIKGFLKENLVEVALLGKQKGTALLISFIIMGVLMLLGLYFLSFTLTETRIARSQTVGTQAYYLAEAGINKAIWKLKNDDTWSTCFVTSTDCSARSNCNATWTAAFTTNTDSLIPNSTTTVSILSPICARGELTATSTIALPGGKTAQRVVKVKVFKASGSLTENSPLYGDGNIEVLSSELNVYKGNVLNDGNVTLSFSQVNVYDNTATAIQEGQVLARGNLSTTSDNILNSSSTCAKNVCTALCKGYATGTTSCPPDDVIIPMIDFDSGDPGSYKEKAKAAQSQTPPQCKVLGKKVGQATTTLSTNCIFSQNEFEDLLWNVGNGGSLILEYLTNGVATSTYYVTGNIEIKGNRTLVINGILVADGNVSIGEKQVWKGHSGFSQVTVEDPGIGIPSGLLAKGNIAFGSHSSDIQIKGLVYTLANFELANLPSSYLYEIHGGQIAAGNFCLISNSRSLDIYLDNYIIQEGVWGGPIPPEGGTPPYSPVVTIEHWEETY